MEVGVFGGWLHGYESGVWGTARSEVRWQWFVCLAETRSCFAWCDPLSGSWWILALLGVGFMVMRAVLWELRDLQSNPHIGITLNTNS